MNKKRINTVIEGLKSLDDSQFNFQLVENECGTMHCVLGHMPTFFPDTFKLKPLSFSGREGYKYPWNTKEDDDDVHSFLGITQRELEFLTEPNLFEREEYGHDIDDYRIECIGSDSPVSDIIYLWEHFRDNRDKVFDFVG